MPSEKDDDEEEEEEGKSLASRSSRGAETVLMVPSPPAIGGKLSRMSGRKEWPRTEKENGEREGTNSAESSEARTESQRSWVRGGPMDGGRGARWEAEAEGGRRMSRTRRSPTGSAGSEALIGEMVRRTPLMMNGSRSAASPLPVLFARQSSSSPSIRRGGSLNNGEETPRKG